ncbi:MAG: hypothetical protein HKP40_10905 [Litoreibacter sp.]|nr:hypothetical protein [Litoreibacter sp.]
MFEEALDFRDEKRNDFSGEEFATNKLIAGEFRKLGFRVEEFGSVIRSTKEGTATFNSQNVTGFDSNLTSRLVKDKPLTKVLLAEAGIRVSEGDHFSLDDKEGARCFVESTPHVAVKPLDGHQGKGVSLDVTPDTFEAAWKKASLETKKGILIERFISGGKEARYLVIDGKCVAVALRLPPFVIGDGTSTIEELVERTNAVRCNNPCRRKYLIRKTVEQLAFLKQRGFTLNSVLGKDETVVLDLKSGPGPGGDTVNITGRVHPSMIALVEKITKTFPGLHVLGADIIAEDHSKPISGNNYIVLEVNTDARIMGHQFPDFGEPINVARLIVESCVERMGLLETVLEKTRSKPSPARASKANTALVPRDDEMTLVFGGDTSLGDTYLARGKYPDAQLRLCKEPESFFERLSPLITDKSHFVLNFESVLADRASDPWGGEKKFMGLDDPDRTVSTLKSIGVDSVSLANNHTMDFGAASLMETIDHFKKEGVNAFGAGNDRLESSHPLTLSTHLGNVHILSGFEYRRSYHEKYRFYSARARPGVQRFRQAPDNQLADEIRDLRSKDQTAFIVAFPHWGASKNYAWANEKMFKVNTSFLKAGADLVMGHGAHMMQQCWVEDRDTTIFSLGNFVFNSPGRYQKLGAPPFSLVARLNLQRHAKRWATRLRLYPIVSDNRITGFSPRPVTEKEALEVYDILTERGQRIFQQSFSLGQDSRGYFVERAGPVSRRCAQLD